MRWLTMRRSIENFTVCGYSIKNEHKLTFKQTTHGRLSTIKHKHHQRRTKENIPTGLRNIPSLFRIRNIE